YTDLLAKLWALDFLNSTPSRHASDVRLAAALLAPGTPAKLWPVGYLSAVRKGHRQGEGFPSKTSVPLSPIYEKEMEQLDSTRLWFGPADLGFQIAGDRKQLLFGRVSTRVFAKSHSSLQRGEVAANAASEAFLGWWNEHYEEVARY